MGQKFFHAFQSKVKLIRIGGTWRYFARRGHVFWKLWSSIVKSAFKRSLVFNLVYSANNFAQAFFLFCFVADFLICHKSFPFAVGLGFKNFSFSIIDPLKKKAWFKVEQWIHDYNMFTKYCNQANLITTFYTSPYWQSILQ